MESSLTTSLSAHTSSPWALTHLLSSAHRYQACSRCALTGLGVFVVNMPREVKLAAPGSHCLAEPHVNILNFGWI